MFGGVLQAASGAQILAGLGIIAAIGLTPAFITHKHMKKQCQLGFEAAVGRALKADKNVQNEVLKAKEEFNKNKNEKYLQLTEADILAGQELALQRGRNSGFLEGQKYALENTTHETNCLGMPYAIDSQLFADAEELRSRIFRGK